MDKYNFKKIHITDLNEYSFERGNFHYVTDDVDFYFKNNNGSNLVVFFHGSLSKKRSNNIIFRGYNYNFDDTDILCLSDRLLKIYYSKGLLLSWYLSTPEYDNFDLYKKVFNKILSNNYNKVIFTGTSGGGYPALIFSSLYKGICLLSNSQIYLNKYGYFNKMISILNLNSNDMFECNIENFMIKYGFPKQIILYTNIRDDNHYKHHSLPFFNFIKANDSDIIIPVFFSGNDPLPGGTHHHIQFPNINYHESILKVLQN